jgi:hypothetical protein
VSHSSWVRVSTGGQGILTTSSFRPAASVVSCSSSSASTLMGYCTQQQHTNRKSYAQAQATKGWGVLHAGLEKSKAVCSHCLGTEVFPLSPTHTLAQTPNLSMSVCCSRCSQEAV